MVNKSAVSVDLTAKDLKVLPEGKSTKLVKTFKDSVKNSQIDGQTESFDEIISEVVCALVTGNLTILSNMCTGYNVAAYPVF